MDDKKLRNRLNKIRESLTIITNEINSIYNDNSEYNKMEEIERNNEYENEVDKMLEDCEGWDIESKALKEAFKRGTEFQQKIIKINEDNENMVNQIKKIF